MKKMKLCAVLTASFLFVGCVQAKFNFSNKSSGIRVGSGASFIVNKDIPGMDGVLDIVDYDINCISGNNSIVFQNGSLGNGFASSIFSGIYSPSGSDTIILQGSQTSPHRLISEIGVISQQISVSGGYNTIEGRPMFTYPIIFDGDLNTTLTIGIQNKLTKNIELNNGTLILSDDLALGDDVLIAGSGVVNLSNKTLHLPGDESNWNDLLFFENANDIELHAKTVLSGIWTFVGQSTINGNGCVLDLTNNGKLVIKPNSQIQLNDITIKGIGNSEGLGSFVFEDESSQIVFSSVTVELESDYTTSLGNIYVDGTSTVLVKDHIWLFDQLGSLTVDGVTLWTDRVGEVVDNKLGIQFDVPESAHYSSVASGTIKMFVGDDAFEKLQALVYSNSNAIVYLNDSLATMHGECAHLFPGEALTFNADQVFDGDGKNIVFSHGDQPQFIVAPGVTLTLQNIELLRVNEKTFDIGYGAKIKIGQNVLFELSEDVTWVSGEIELIGDNNLFVMRGVGGRKQFTFRCPCQQQDLILNLGTGTMLLQNIEFSGLHFCDGSRKFRDRYFMIVGAIAIGGNSIVNVDYSTYMNFVAQGNDNELRLRTNDVALRGNLLFGDLPENDLHIKFLLDDEGLVIPRVRFDNAFMFVASTKGWANLIFDDAYVQVYNETPSSFVVGERSVLDGYRLEILNNPIKQVSRNFIMQPAIELLTDLDNAIEQEFIRLPFQSSGISDARVFRGLISTGSDLEINYNTVKLSNAKNSIWVRGGAITSFGVSSDDALFLTMVDGSTLVQTNRDAIFKYGDELRIQGRSNKIFVTNRFVINGNLLFDEQSDVTFEFVQSENNGVLPEVYFASDYRNLLEIPNGSRLKFKGKGRIIFQDGYVIQLTGGMHQQAECIIEDSAELSLQEQATICLVGRGKLLIDDKARLHVGSNQQVIVGQDSSDSIALIVDRQGEIEIEDRKEQGCAKLSLQSGAYAIDVMHRGMIAVNKGGLFEINLVNQQVSSGVLSRFTLQSGGILQIDEGGLLQIAQNKMIDGQEVPILWDNVEGTLLTGGIFAFANTDLAGQIKNISFGPTKLLTESLVSFFINQKPEFTAATLFVDAAGNRKIRTRNGVVVNLLDGDEATREDHLAGIITIVNDGEIFAITPNGNRI